MKYNGLTKWGKEYMASLALGDKTLTLAKIEVGDGLVTTIDEACSLANLISFKKECPIISIETTGSTSSIKSQIDNIGITTGFVAREVGIYVRDNGNDFLFWYINHDNDVTYIYPESGGLLRIENIYQMIHAGSDVTVVNSSGLDYFVTKEYMEGIINTRAKVHVGDEPPIDDSFMWVDTTDKNIQSFTHLNPTLQQIIMNTLKELKTTVDEMNYKMTKKLDAGVRRPKPTKLNNLRSIGPDYPDLPDDYRPSMEEYLEATLNHLCIARGKRDAVGNLLGGEMFYATDEKALYIGDDKGNIILLCKMGGGGGGGTLTGEYLELVSPKGISYKVRVSDQGVLEVYKSAIDNRPLPNPDDPDKLGWDAYKADGTGLCVNQIYSGGKMHSENTPVSHSFIEIYNNSERDISLRGLSVQYCKMGVDWKVCPLDGMLPGNTSFLIRCQENTNPYKLACRLKINRYDMEWDQELSPTGMKVALVVGTKPLTCPDPFKDPPRIEPIHQYIDMLSAGGEKESEKIDYAEGYFVRHCLNKDTAICRIFNRGLKDRDSSLLDTMSVDYRYADIEKYGPKCRADGAWDIYRVMKKMSPNRPNMIIPTFGKTQSTRIFTWQSLPTDDGFVKYRKIANSVFKNGSYVNEEIVGLTKWITVRSTMKNITHHDTSAISHHAIIRDLTPGLYLYKCGSEGEWSDENEMEIFHEHYGDFTSSLSEGETMSSRSVRILHTTDQQGWDEYEYKCWRLASDFIVKNEKTDLLNKNIRPNYEWRINTGDESQNGNRSYEWRYYYDAAKEDIANSVEMSVAGNNDLIDKKKSEAYTYYTTYEDSPYPSCYEFFIGDIHFLGFHTWAHVDDDYKDLVSVDSDVEDPNSKGFVNKQIKWLKEKLSGPRKRWTVVLTHVAPFTIVKMKNAQPYRAVLEGMNGLFAPVDVVICGHNHSYSRSKAMLGFESDGSDRVDPLNGVYHVMAQAAGFKLSGKEKPQAGSKWYAIRPDGTEAASVPPHPCYIMWEITQDYIEMKTYQITGVVHSDELTKEVTYGTPNTFKKEMIDSFKIYHRSKRSEHLDEL